MNRIGMGVAAATGLMSVDVLLAEDANSQPEPGWVELERPATPGASRAFYPAAISGDGHVVVGREWYSDSEDQIAVSRAAVWNQGTLSWLSEPNRSSYIPDHALAYAVNRTGSVIAGLASLSDPPAGMLNGACIWYEGLPALPSATGYPGVQPVLVGGMNTDGSVLVGRAYTDDFRSLAYRIDEGQFLLLEPLTGAAGEATATSVSHDGRVTVGFSTNELGFPEAVRWVGGTVEALDAFPSWASASYATDTNEDGTVIVGRIMMGEVALHFRWENGEYEVIDGLDPIGPVDVPYARSIAINADGSVIVGGFNDRAFYWTRATGTRPMRTAAIESGIAIPCCTRLLNSLDVSDDGRTVLVRGRGRDLVITLGTEAVEGDANGDGQVNLQDLNILLSQFGLESTGGDLNGDGMVNLQDLNILLSNFGA